MDIGLFEQEQLLRCLDLITLWIELFSVLAEGCNGKNY